MEYAKPMVIIDMAEYKMLKEFNNTYNEFLLLLDHHNLKYELNVESSSGEIYTELEYVAYLKVFSRNESATKDPIYESYRTLEIYQVGDSMQSQYLELYELAIEGIKTLLDK